MRLFYFEVGFGSMELSMRGVGVEEFVKRAVEQGTLPHACLFSHGVTENFLQGMASYLETGRWEIERGVLSDTMFIRPDEAGSIGIDVVRDGRRFLFLGRGRGKKKLLVVFEAERMTAAAQNAILKILEEPPRDGMIVLVTAEPRRLLPPILSRVQQYFFPDVTQGKVFVKEEWVEKFEKFLRAKDVGRTAFIKEMAASEAATDIFDFLRAGMYVLGKDSLRYAGPLRGLMSLYQGFSRSPLNKRLQLEAWKESFSG
jgi:hypothetical protein